MQQIYASTEAPTEDNTENVGNNQGLYIHRSGGKCNFYARTTGKWFVVAQINCTAPS